MATATQTRIPASAFNRLCSIERKLHKWAEDECNGRIQWETHPVTGEDAPRLYGLDRWGSYTIPCGFIPNRERLYLMEASKIAAQCGGLVYHQGDPRGCALHFYRPEDLEGRKFPIDSIYSSVALPCCR
jgi:hypothetical protein